MSLQVVKRRTTCPPPVDIDTWPAEQIYRLFLINKNDRTSRRWLTQHVHVPATMEICIREENATSWSIWQWLPPPLPALPSNQGLVWACHFLLFTHLRCIYDDSWFSRNPKQFKSKRIRQWCQKIPWKSQNSVRTFEKMIRNHQNVLRNPKKWQNSIGIIENCIKISKFSKQIGKNSSKIH